MQHLKNDGDDTVTPYTGIPINKYKQNGKNSQTNNYKKQGYSFESKDHPFWQRLLCKGNNEKQVFLII